MINKDVAYFAARHDLRTLPILPTAGHRLAISEQHYDLPVELDVAFEAYRTSPPWEVWPAKRLEFQQALVPGNKTPIRAGDPWPNLHEGLRIFSNLSLHPVGLGFIRLYVGVEVTRVETNEEIRYDYLQGSVTRGYNSMRFSSQGPGVTHVHHVSEYRGTSVRDRLLMWPLQRILHVGFVDDMHAGLRRVLAPTH